MFSIRLLRAPCGTSRTSSACGGPRRSSSGFNRKLRLRWCSSVSPWKRSRQRSTSKRVSPTSTRGYSMPQLNTEVEADRSCVAVASVNDIVTARLQGRALAERLRFLPGEATPVATAISELAGNILQYPGKRAIELRAAEDGGPPGDVLGG